MAIKARVSQQGNTQKATVSQEGVVQTTTVAISPSLKLLDLSDVDSALLGEGAVLIYNSETEKFETKQEIDNPNTKIIGGSF